MNLENIRWEEFEKLIAVLWEKFGYNTRVTSPGKDGGIDVIAERSDPYHEKIVIQVKNYSVDNKIGVQSIREYSSLLHRSNVDGVVIVTSGYYTKQARNEAEEIGVKLVNRDSVEQLIDEHLYETQTFNPTKKLKRNKNEGDSAELETPAKSSRESHRLQDSESRTTTRCDDDLILPEITDDDQIPDISALSAIRDGMEEYFSSNSKESQHVSVIPENDNKPIYQYVGTIHQIPISDRVDREAIIKICDEYNLKYIDKSEQNIAARWEKYWTGYSHKANIEHDSIIATKFVSEILGDTSDIELELVEAEQE